MIKNCRNCKWADIPRHPSGRRDFNAWAECKYPVAEIKLPISRVLDDVVLKRKASAPAHKKINLSCDTWEAA